jgi:hypothetical protein
MGRAAAERCEGRYGVARMADALMALYENPARPGIGAVA